MLPPAVRLGMSGDTSLLAFVAGAGDVGIGARLPGAVSTAIQTGVGGGDVGVSHLLHPSLVAEDFVDHISEIIVVRWVCVPHE